ncbi:MAG: hypothetical protein LBT83_03285 [Tannerella sp.]|jgi:mannose/fructose/N-acetylgalactosamine-specific phosphotransferase system component IIC|nr:hypothetical protein [Tannerella sp.]
MKKDPAQFFRELKDDVTTYAELKIELLKLGAYDRIGKVLSVLSYGLILLILGFFLTLFIFLALGFFLSEWLHSTGTGFSIVAILYLLLTGGVVLCRDAIRTYILNTVIDALTGNENIQNNATDQDNPTDEPANP